VEVKGLTLENAEIVVTQYLKTILKDPLVMVTRDATLPQAGAIGQLEKMELRIQNLEKEVRALRTIVDRLEKK
jgi:hypothetical protein